MAIGRSGSHAFPPLEAFEPRRLFALDFSNVVTFGQLEEFDQGLAVLTDAGGNTYVAGTFRGKMDPDPRKDVRRRLQSAGDSDDIFIVKYAPNRNVIWARKFGAESNEQVSVMRFAPDGDIILAGQFDDDTDFGTRKDPRPIPGSGDLDIYIARLNPDNGSLRYVRTIGGGNDDFLTALNVSPAGDIFYSATLRLRADIDPGPRQRLIETVGVDDTLFSRLDGATGDLRWFRVIGEDDTRETVRGIEFDAKGSPIFFGAFNRELRFDRGNTDFDRESVGEDDVYMLRLRAGNGRVDWVKTFGGGEQDTIADLAVAADGTFHVTGNFVEDADFDPGRGRRVLVALSDSDAYVARYRPNGSLLWARQIGGPDARIAAKAVTVDSAGNVFTVGDFNADDDTALVIRLAGGATRALTTDKDEAPALVRALGATDVYAVSLNSDGRFTEAVQFGGDDGTVFANDVAASNGFIEITGGFAGEDGTDFDPDPTRTRLRTTTDERGDADIFLLRLRI